MKKIYLKPEIEILNIEPTIMLAASEEDLGVWEDITVDEALSKEHKVNSVWDFEEED